MHVCVCVSIDRVRPIKDKTCYQTPPPVKEIMSSLRHSPSLIVRLTISKLIKKHI